MWCPTTLLSKVMRTGGQIPASSSSLGIKFKAYFIKIEPTKHNLCPDNCNMVAHDNFTAVIYSADQEIVLS